LTPQFALPAGPPYPAIPGIPGIGRRVVHQVRRGRSRRARRRAPSLVPTPNRRRTTLFYILIFGLLAVVLVVAFAKKWSSRNKWPEDD